MAKFNKLDYEQAVLIPVVYANQILPGSFADVLNRMIDRNVNLDNFKSRYKNDLNGAPAYDPAALLKIILFAYYNGIKSSRKIEQVCRENITFMALTANSRPCHHRCLHFHNASTDRFNFLRCSGHMHAEYAQLIFLKVQILKNKENIRLDLFIFGLFDGLVN